MLSTLIYLSIVKLHQKNPDVLYQLIWLILVQIGHFKQFQAEISSVG